MQQPWHHQMVRCICKSVVLLCATWFLHVLLHLCCVLRSQTSATCWMLTVHPWCLLILGCHQECQRHCILIHRVWRAALYTCPAMHVMGALPLHVGCTGHGRLKLLIATSMQLRHSDTAAPKLTLLLPKVGAGSYRFLVPQWHS